MLVLNGVKKNYGDFKLNCTMNVKEGMITGLIGANGAGKSTTFKSVLGLIQIEEGDITLFGKSIKDITAEDKEAIGVVMSDGSFSQYLTIKQIIPVMSAMYKSFDKKKFIEECNRFSLPLNKKLKEFSSGMKARLNVLLAISHEAKLLILDEPTAGLDVIARNDLLDMLREYMEVEGRSIIVSSHISDDLESLCDDLYMIHKGEIIMHEETDTLIDEYGIIKVTEEDYNSLDKKYLKYVMKEKYGYACLTDSKQFYVENYPMIAIEKGNIDDFLTIAERGERV